MVEMGKLYKKDSIPLEEVNNVNLGDVVYNEEGHCLEYKGESEFEVVRFSPLIQGELLSAITDDKVLKLFWTLAKNNRYAATRTSD